MATIAKQTIYLNLRPGAVMPVLHVSQGDSGLEALEFKLINGSQPWLIPASVTDIQLNGTTPVGVFSYSDPTWSGNTVTANVTETMTAERGLTLCELRLLDSTLNSIGTLNFVIAVEPSPFTNAHVSTSDMAVITESLNGSQRNMLLSKSWAVGDTGMRDGEDTNNSKYWSEVSDDNGQRWAIGSVDGTAVSTTDPSYHNNSKYWSEQSDINGERWSVGQIDGSDVPPSDVTYHNNSKWWSSISESWAVGGTGNRGGEDTNNSKYWSEQSDINGERWSVGQKNGEDVSSTDPTYHNNSKYWSMISHQYANEVSYKKVYESVAEMKADEELIDGQICRTLGYYAANDGGGGLYRIDSTVTETYHETLLNGLYAILIIENVVSPKMFGAVGDGVSDGTEAFQNAISYAWENGYNILIPSGDYIISESLTIPQIATIIEGKSWGNSQRATKIHYTGTDALFVFNGTSCITVGKIEIYAPNGTGIKLTGNRNYNVRIHDININDCVCGIYIDSSTGYTYFDRINIESSDKTTRALYLSSAAANTIFANYVYFTECSFDANNATIGKTLIELGRCYYIYFDKCDFANANVGVLSTLSANAIKYISCEFFNIEQCIYYDNSITNYYRNDMFIGCGFRGTKGISADSKLTNNVQKCAVVGCSMNLSTEIIGGKISGFRFVGNNLLKKPSTSIVGKIFNADGIAENRIYFVLAPGESHDYTISNGNNLLSSYGVTTSYANVIRSYVLSVTDTEITIRLVNDDSVQRTGYAMIF